MTFAEEQRTLAQVNRLRIFLIIAFFLLEGTVGYVSTLNIDWVAVAWMICKAYAVFVALCVVGASIGIALTFYFNHEREKGGAGY